MVVRESVFVFLPAAEGRQVMERSLLLLLLLLLEEETTFQKGAKVGWGFGGVGVSHPILKP